MPVFLRVANPANPGVEFTDLNIVAGSFREELEWRGISRPAFDGTMLSTRNNSRRVFRCTAQFLIPQQATLFRQSLAESLDATTFLPISLKVMLVSSIDDEETGQGAFRGFTGTVLMHIEPGELVAVRDQSQGPTVNQVWTMDLTLREHVSF